jgi:hypothetical protein
MEKRQSRMWQGASGGSQVQLKIEWLWLASERLYVNKNWKSGGVSYVGSVDLGGGNS